MAGRCKSGLGTSYPQIYAQEGIQDGVIFATIKPEVLPMSKKQAMRLGSGGARAPASEEPIDCPSPGGGGAAIAPGLDRPDWPVPPWVKELDLNEIARQDLLLRIKAHPGAKSMQELEALERGQRDRRRLSPAAEEAINAARRHRRK